MDYNLFRSQYSWREFALTILLLAFIYLVLYVLKSLSRRPSFSGYFQAKVKEFLRELFIIYEIVALIILTGVFILINPIFHGLLALLLVWASFSYLKSYVGGRWIQMDNVITEGTELKTSDKHGMVSNMGRVRIDLQTNEGLCHINYDRLITDGYTLVSGEEIGGFYYLEFSPKESLTKIKNHRQHLMDLLATAPYIDLNHKPELFRDDEKPNTVDGRILIKEETHLHELVALVKEWGYNCKLVS